MTTLDIKPGSWAVLRNGEVRGPVEVRDENLYPKFPVVAGDRTWALSGAYHYGGESNFDIIATLPGSPMERIAELEAENSRLADERYKLAYAITGGEDAPGLLRSMSVADLVTAIEQQVAWTAYHIDQCVRLEAALQVIIDRSNDITPGTGKVPDMRKIAENALKGGEA